MMNTNPKNTPDPQPEAWEIDDTPMPEEEIEDHSPIPEETYTDRYPSHWDD